jgi:hypothetical protein
VSRNSAEATVRAEAPRELVWDVLVDVRSWQEWGDWHTTKLEREGDPAPNGIGAIRFTARRPLKVREQVEVWEPPSRFGYTLLSGLPLRDYHSVVTLTDAGEGATNLHWESRFDVAVPGTNGLFRMLVRKTLEDIATKLARESERRLAHSANRIDRHVAGTT